MVTTEFSGIPQSWIRAVSSWAASIPEISAVWLFGSYARSDSTTESDLDLAIETVGDDTDDRWNNWFEEEDWPILSLPPIKGWVYPQVDKQWFDPTASMEVVGPAVASEGICLWRR